VFRLLGINEASAAFKEVRDSAKETGAASDEANESSGLFGMGAGTALLAVGAGAAVLAVKCIDMAAKFQSAMTTLVTGAGESQKNMKLVSNGILDMAVSTGTSTTQLISGMYMIESAGFHGAAGLTVLKAAAEGAKVGNADLGDVGNALTDVLNDYHEPASKAVDVTDMLVATVAAGKQQMGDLASSLSNVVPLASSAHLSFAQVAGAEATMTLHGMSAQQATQDLANEIRSLQAPNAVAVQEMQQLGLNSNQVSMQLGQKGLTGTLAELTSAITTHMGPAGTVLQSAFASSTTAAQDAKTMIDQMPSSLQALANSYLDGSVSAKTWRTDLQGLDPVQSHLMAQFASVADKTHSFNSLLAAGGPAAQTYNAALEKMTGGATGLTTSLMLSGENAAMFEANVKAIGAAGQSTSKDVTGWSDVTNTLSFKLDQAKEVVETLAIRIGTLLMPVAKALVGGFIDIVSHAGDVMHVFGDVAHAAEDVGHWFEQNKTVAEALGIGLAAVGVVLVAQAIPAVIASTVAWADQAAATIAAASATVVAAAPYIAIAAAVALVAYGILELVQHWQAVTAFFSGAAKDVANFFMDDLVKPVGQFFTVDIPGYWDDATACFTSVFVDPVKTAVHDVTGFFTSDLEHPIAQLFGTDIPRWFEEGVALFDSVFVDPVKGAVHDVESAFSSTFGAIPGFITSAFGDAEGVMKAPLNGIIDLVDDVIGGLDSISVSIPSWVPGVGGDRFGISIPKIPQLAAGGLVLPQPGGTQVTVAEAGQAEIVSPIPALEQAMTVALQNSGMGGAGFDPAQLPGSASNPLHAELDLMLNGQQINRTMVVFQQQGGVFTAARMAAP
jgi:TP901 family phage tail tape measure protein